MSSLAPSTTLGKDGGNPLSEPPLPSPESQTESSSVYKQMNVIDFTLEDDDTDDDVQILEPLQADHTVMSVKNEPDEQPMHPENENENGKETQQRPGSNFEQDPPQASIDTTQRPTPIHESFNTTGQQSNGIPAVGHADDDPTLQLQALHDFLNIHANSGLDEEDTGDNNGFSRLYDTNASVNSDEEDKRARDTFKVVKRSYEAKKRNQELDITDYIELQKAYNAEDERKRLRQSKQAYRYEEELRDEHSMFYPEKSQNPQLDREAIPEEQLVDFELPASQRVILSREVFEIEDGGAESEPQSQEQKTSARRGRKTKGGTQGRGTLDRVKKAARGKKATPVRGRGGGRRGGRGGRKNGRQGIDMIDENQFFQHNIIEEATANRGQAQQPGFASKNRKDALTELIASMPEEHQDRYHGDKVDLDKAVKMFRGAGTLKQTAMRSDGEGGWKLRGMKTSLKHYQLLGAAFLRSRENSQTRPKGGILSDEMGLGKTVMMIANIVDGRPTDTHRATLIVVPPALTTQWMVEIDKHAERDALRDVVVYRSGSRVMATDPVRVLANNDVVITSYHEVLKSMPRNEPPLRLVTSEAKQEWWEKQWKEKRGVLHLIKWHRIVLDEAQAIKNHLSKTSEAISHLEGRYRWAISGTPIQNCLEEFYSYFRFLRCDHTGSFELFKKNFCKRGSPAAIQRLQVYLTKIMCRRTHVNKLFGRPILQLPAIKPVETIEVEFNPVERAIYHIVRERFVSRIKALGSKDNLEKSYRTVFVLLLRLRQLVSSPLLIQKTLKDLLQTEDLERLWQMTEDPSNQSDGDDGTATLRTLRLALSNVTSQDPSLNRADSGYVSNSNDGDMLSMPKGSTPDTDDSRKLSYQFRKCLQSLHDDGQWAKANDRSLCHACARPPVKPYITSCLHLYCLSCLTDLQYEAAVRDDNQATCLECGRHVLKSEALAARGFEEASTRNASSLSVHSGLRTNRKGSDDEEEDIDWFTIGGPILQSAKTKGAVKKMKEWWAADPNAKIIIFVQFRALIKIFQRICQEQGWDYTYFHGAMPFEARDMAIKEFSDEKDTKVMIAALKAGGVGLNLVAANRVIIIDLWWNESVESQAWCRVFRIGQERDVEVARFVVKDTIDTDILLMQKRKTLEIESAMDEKKRQARLSTQELLRLFGPISIAGTPLPAEDGVFDGEDEPFTFVEDPYEKRDDDAEMMDTPA